MGVEAPSFEQIVHVIGVFFAIALPIGVALCFAFVPQGAAETDDKPPSWRGVEGIPAG